MTSTLTIYDLSPNDVGRYQCNMDNGIGSPAVRTIDLTYPCKFLTDIKMFMKFIPFNLTTC